MGGVGGRSVRGVRRMRSAGRGVEDGCASGSGGRVSTLTHALSFVLEPVKRVVYEKEGGWKLGVAHTYQI